MNPSPTKSVEPDRQPAQRAGDARERQAARGSVELVLGCMFSGKTTRMVRWLGAAQPQRCAAFKHVRDTRYMRDAIVTHSGLSIEAEVVADAEEVLSRIMPHHLRVGIDEAHFFDSGLPQLCAQLRSRGIEVMLTGLDRTSWGRPFPLVERLREVADVVHEMAAVCGRCGEPGELTQRLTPVVDGDIFGGPEAFEPRCAACWRPPPEPPVD